MSATRRLERFLVRLDTTTGQVKDVMARTEIELSDRGLTVQVRKEYLAAYQDLGAGAQARIDAIVADVETFIENREPIT